MVPRLILCLAWLSAAVVAQAADLPPKLSPYFQPPPELAQDLGSYRSPLKFDNGEPVRNATDWSKRRAEILKYWHAEMGPWPALIEKPKLELGEKTERDGYTQYAIKVETAPGR